MRLDSLTDYTVVAVKGIYYLPEESDPAVSPEAIELIFKESGSLDLTSGTDWTLRIEKGDWPKLPKWCYPPDEWAYRDIPALSSEVLGKIHAVDKQVNGYGDLVQIELQFEGGSRIVAASGESLTVTFTSADKD
ncbi:hypothetical protein [Streptomyces rhizosphaericus]|uniref:Uncharacterized protein n=1 Tax=Streptomyces rhizosphaericus TaxID=114699 RepID=A0A6G4AHI2_9ACTN|nr:hypothetical protein [Streptomyces rhizosphaericus]NEW72803.1 hypothetical protein [Streptomyces rhizosphaericus]